MSGAIFGRGKLVFGVRGKRGKQCFHALGVLSVLPGTSPPSVKLRVQFLAYGLAMIDKPAKAGLSMAGMLCSSANGVELHTVKCGAYSSLLLAPSCES